LSGVSNAVPKPNVASFPPASANEKSLMNLRVILITGANGGLGQAMARSFLNESPHNCVWLGVHTRRDAADKLAGEFSDRCFCIDLDVTQPVSSAAWEKVRSTNLDATFHGCQAVLPAMISQRGGRIVNMASLSALLAPAGQTNYAAAKAGIVALTQSLAKEVARLNITVNALCPGYVETDILSGMTEDERKAAQSRVPMRRFGRPEEVAAAARFLACAEAGYITGSILKVDGGIL
jgi:3-oxoacyl-[acyl-carrier protein] reductase